jgi:hypothetical protein
MAVAALKREPRRKMFYATMHVTRVEEWCIKADTEEERVAPEQGPWGTRTHWGVHQLRGCLDRRLRSRTGPFGTVRTVGFQRRTSRDAALKKL